MKGLTKMLCAAGLLVVVMGILFEIIQLREPVYEGRPLSVWLKAFGDSTPQEREKPTRAIQAIGTNAIPTLLRKLYVRKNPLKEKLMSMDNSWDWKFPFQRADDVRWQGVNGFRILGTIAKAATPELVKAFYSKDENVRAAAEAALKAVDPEEAELHCIDTFEPIHTHLGNFLIDGKQSMVEMEERRNELEIRLGVSEKDSGNTRGIDPTRLQGTIVKKDGVKLTENFTSWAGVGNAGWVTYWYHFFLQPKIPRQQISNIQVSVDGEVHRFALQGTNLVPGR
jgi:hypothetical protein